MQDNQEAKSGTPVLVCKNCGCTNINNFCADCGQEVFKQRFTLKKLLKEWISAFYNYSGGILFTVRSLALHPGNSIKEYISGKTIPYWNPFNYFVITFSVYLLISIKTGVFGSESKFDTFTNDYASYMVIFTIPFMAFCSFILFRKTGFNFAENLVLNIFTVSQINIYSTILLILNIFLRSRTASLISILVGFIYYVWVCKQFFNQNILIVILKSIIIHFIQFLVLSIFLIIAYFIAN
jgi:hypothetical protein